MEPRAVAILDGGRVREELKRVGLTQRELAKKMGVRDATVSDAMRGHPCSPDTIFRISLGLSLAEPVK